MSPLWAGALWFLGALVVVALVILAYINVRARRLDGQLGAFRCWSRPDKQSGWTSGIGLFGVETLSWFPLVGLSNRPVYTLARRGLEISSPIDHSLDGSMVQVRLKTGEKRYEMAVTRHTYNALVSWVESGPPAVRR